LEGLLQKNLQSIGAKFVLAKIIKKFGEADRDYPKWTLDEEDSRPILKKPLI